MQKPKKIAILASQWPNKINTGGIAAPTSKLAMMLASKGYEVKVFLVRVPKPQIVEIRNNNKDLNIEFIETNYKNTPWWLSTQYETLMRILDWKADLVISQEWQGLAMSLVNTNIPVISWTHGATLYDLHGRDDYFETPFQALENEIERSQIEFSKYVVSPSRFLLNYYKTQSLLEHDRVEVIPYHFGEFSKNNRKNAYDDKIKIFFIGQLSRRKGFDIFVTFLKSAKVKLKANFEVHIYGESIHFSGKDEVKYLKENGIEATYYGITENETILKNLSTGQSLLVTTSRLDNSPNTVYEAIKSGAHNLIIGSKNGAAELKHYFASISVADSTEEIDWEELEKNIKQPSSEVSLSEFDALVNDKWLRLIENATEVKPKQNTEREQKVTVIITTKDRPELLNKCLLSVSGQTKTPFNVILVDDNSACSDINKSIFKKHFPKGDYILNSKSIGPGASRNIAVKKSVTEFVAFIDDDNEMRPNHLSTCLDVITNELSAVASTLNLIDSYGNKIEGVVTFFGNALPKLHSISNLAGDTHGIFRREDFLKIGGFDENWPSSQEDWALYLKFYSRGYKTAVNPLPTINYRYSPDSIQRNIENFNSWFEVDRNTNPNGASVGYMIRWAMQTNLGNSQSSLVGRSLFVRGVVALIMLDKRTIHKALQIIRNNPRILTKLFK